MHTAIKQSIIALAKERPNEEICGFIYQGLKGAGYAPCDNVALDKREDFEIAAADYVRVTTELGPILGIYHSHPSGGGNGFTSTDTMFADEAALPLYLYIIDTDEWSCYLPSSYSVPLEGRLWSWGFWDCYETVRIYYRQNKKVYLTDYDRDDNHSEQCPTQIVDNFKREGFRELDFTKESAAEGDVMLFKMPGQTHPCHVAIIMSGNKILHHIRNQLSITENLEQHWVRRMSRTLRYVGKDIPQ